MIGDIVTIMCAIAIILLSISIIITMIGMIIDSINTRKFENNAELERHLQLSKKIHELQMQIDKSDEPKGGAK